MLDNVFSAIDKVTAHAVFDEVLLDAMAGKTRILATNDFDHLTQCDRIIIMKEGRVHNQGAYEELLANDEYFKEVIKSGRLQKDVQK